MGGISPSARFDPLEDVEHFDGFYLGNRAVPDWDSDVLQHPSVFIEGLFGGFVPLQIGKILVCYRGERVLSGS